MSELVLTGLYRYPVKSLRGESHAALPVGRRGLVSDREWMLVDDAGRFLTQRQLPRMALIDARLDDAGRLELTAGGMPAILVDAADGPSVEVQVWGDSVNAILAAPAASAWLCDFLDHQVRLVRFAPDAERPVDPTFADAQDRVGFADGFPFLLISQASLDGLNERLAEPVPMRRFRPNLVIEGCAPHAEDNWNEIRIGALRFRVAKPCSRCIIPTIDIASAVRGPEPLRTLMSYRKRDNKIYFGQNLLHSGEGELRLGMSVEVLS